MPGDAPHSAATHKPGDRVAVELTTAVAVSIVWGLAGLDGATCRRDGRPARRAMNLAQRRSTRPR